MTKPLTSLARCEREEEDAVSSYLFSSLTTKDNNFSEIRSQDSSASLEHHVRNSALTAVLREGSIGPVAAAQEAESV